MVFLAFFSCSEQSEQQKETFSEESPVADSTQEDFEDFYARFHSDSLFQMKRIQFPIGGLPPRVDSITLAEDRFTWPKASWRMHRPLDPRDKNYTRELNWVGDEMVQEYIINTRTGYGLERRFVTIDGKWHLIYYAAMNKLERTKD